MTNLAAAIKRIGERARVTQSYICRVDSVNKKKCTIDCTPLNGDASFIGVRLRSKINGDNSGFVLIPKKGSDVIVQIIERSTSEAYLAMVSETDEVWIETADGKYMKITGGKINLNGTKYKLIKDDELKKELDKVNKLLQALLGVINTAIPIAEAGGGAASAFQAAFKSAVAGLQLPTYQDITNDNVTHG